MERNHDRNVCRKLGNCRLKMRREWTKQEEDFLEKWYNKKGVSYFANKLNRTEDSIKRKAQKMGLNAYICDRLYVKTIAKCFNCDSVVINRWILKYGLPFSIVTRGQLTCKLIEQEKFWKWAEEHANLIPWHKYERGTILPEPNWIKEHIREYAYKNNRKRISENDKLSVIFLRRKGYTFKQISKETSRTLDSVKHIWRAYEKVERTNHGR